MRAGWNAAEQALDPALQPALPPLHLKWQYDTADVVASPLQDTSAW
jgi:hypothetical protein